MCLLEKRRKRKFLYGDRISNDTGIGLIGSRVNKESRVEVNKALQRDFFFFFLEMREKIRKKEKCL